MSTPRWGSTFLFAVLMLNPIMISINIGTTCLDLALSSLHICRSCQVFLFHQSVTVEVYPFFRVRSSHAYCTLRLDVDPAWRMTSWIMTSAPRHAISNSPADSLMAFCNDNPNTHYCCEVCAHKQNKSPMGTKIINRKYLCSWYRILPSQRGPPIVRTYNP